MKKLASLALIATSLAVSAQALVVGVDAGYLLDAKEEYISARLGHEFKADTNLGHSAEIEVGYTGQKEAGIKASSMPVTINYRAESKAEKLGYYFGAGAGLARTELKAPGSGVPTISDSDTSFAAQAFAGLTYHASATVSLHAGVKYIWIDDVKLLGINAEVGDDVAFSGGLSIKF
ncbi:MAG TPA: outer membrane beta-barrel protein [Lacunisphaera sp.]|nr:outer membrane beta-barrel protein [Lacunisphaera sp.]